MFVLPQWASTRGRGHGCCARHTHHGEQHLALTHPPDDGSLRERHGVDASMDGSMDGWTDGCSGRIDGWIDGRMDGEVVEGRIVSRIAVRTSLLYCLAYRMYRCRCYRKEFFLRNITQYFLFIIIVTITTIIL